MTDKEKVERVLASVMDQIPEVEGLIAADFDGNVIIGQTLTSMDHSMIIKNIIKVIDASKELSTSIEKGSLNELRITSDEGFTLVIIGISLIFVAITGTDAASSLGLIVRNLSVALKQF